MIESAVHRDDPVDFYPVPDGHSANDAAANPRVGEIYRDRSNRSLVVLTLIGNDALVEYADGTLTRFNAHEWRMLKPQPHRF